MPIVAMVDNPHVSQEIYDKVREELGLDRSAGGIFHAAGPSPTGGWRVIELWESEDEARQFYQERLRPALQAVGATGPPPQPQFWPVHNYMK